jgi:hypothetical protein
VIFLTTEGTWGALGIALLYGLFRLGRRRSYDYTSDLVGLAVAGLLIGGFLRFSGTLAAVFDPERAAIFTAILLAAPVTLWLDDVMSIQLHPRIYRSPWIRRLSLLAGSLVFSVLVLGATGLGALFFGGEPQGSLSSHDLPADEFTVSTPELATALWLRDNVHYPSVVQTDYPGQVILRSEPGSFNLLPEIVPSVVDEDSYIYLSTLNLSGDLSQADSPAGLVLVYRSNIRFFNRNFFVVYSTGTTRVYH